MNNIGILDIQCFLDNNHQYVVKELAVIPLNAKTEYNGKSKMFQAPYPFSLLNAKIQRANNWNTYNHHHLKWHEGIIPYDELSTTINQLVEPYKMLFVMGNEKTEYIKTLLKSKSVVNIEPTLFSLKKINIDVTCSHEGVCALRNCFKIRNLFFEL